MSEYQEKENEEGKVIFRVSDSAWIPSDFENMDYQAFLAWVAEGNSPKKYDSFA
jgi:hypothetical protein